MPRADNSTEPVDVNIKQFLGAVFPDDMRQPNESVLVSWPESFTDRETGRVVDFHKQRAWNPRATGLFPEGAGWLYCVSTVLKQEKIRRRLVDVQAAYVLPCDDVGTKASRPPVEPSYILETSEGNYQYGYLIDPFDVSSPANAAFYDACLLGLAQAGYNDFGCRSASRVIKLPGATHPTGFVSRMVAWHPERVWDLGDLMSEMDVDPALDAVRARGRAAAGRYVDLSEVTDPLYKWLERHGMVLGYNSDWVHIQCPWAHLHSDPEEAEAGFSPLDYGTAGRSFKCFHSHGDDHGLQQFLAWVTEQGGPSTDPSFQRLKMLARIKNDV